MIENYRLPGTANDWKLVYQVQLMIEN